MYWVDGRQQKGYWLNGIYIGEIYDEKNNAYVTDFNPTANSNNNQLLKENSQAIKSRYHVDISNNPKIHRQQSINSNYSDSLNKTTIVHQNLHNQQPNPRTQSIDFANYQNNNISRRSSKQQLQQRPHFNHTKHNSPGNKQGGNKENSIENSQSPPRGYSNKVQIKFRNLPKNRRSQNKNFNQDKQIQNQKVFLPIASQDQGQLSSKNKNFTLSPRLENKSNHRIKNNIGSLQTLQPSPYALPLVYECQSCRRRKDFLQNSNNLNNYNNDNNINNTLSTSYDTISYNRLSPKIPNLTQQNMFKPQQRIYSNHKLQARPIFANQSYSNKFFKTSKRVIYHNKPTWRPSGLSSNFNPVGYDISYTNLPSYRENDNSCNVQRHSSADHQKM
eukprot:TRINITY_DN6056_c0_g1_i1.p1 TRINITY_DN6056_c0_g1~~TRINITY_DN6056_c0_g1_i1.p1  ORF type:complete len:388 (-),score=41.49 TRINITY_DN6056_c0_g1_i1:219-1382(-)